MAAGIRYWSGTVSGYQNLCRMLTRAKLRTTKDKPTIVQPGELAEFAQGLICLTGDENGPLAKALREERGSACLNPLSTIFGKGNVFVELQRHFQTQSRGAKSSSHLACQKCQAAADCHEWPRLRSACSAPDTRRVHLSPS